MHRVKPQGGDIPQIGSLGQGNSPVRPYILSNVLDPWALADADG
jgi:hypothetical protein